MTTEAESLRREIRELADKRARGDVTDRAFEKKNEKLTVELSRLLVRERLAPGESLLAEHHVIRAHIKLAGSILRENEQEIIALLATDRRLFRLRSVQRPGQPLTFDEGGRDEIEAVPLARIRRIAVRRELRMGQVMTGAGISAIALLFRSWLQITGIALVLVGAAGVLHALVFPTRWAEIIVDGSGAGEPFRIYALRKRSAKKLIRLISASAKGG